VSSSNFIYTRRAVLRAGGGLVAMTALSPCGRLLAAAQSAPGVRRPGSLPDASRPAGEPTAALPFDHIVVVMMENHSFDNYLGMLPRRGQPLADGFTFDAAGRPTNRNPVKGGYITLQHAPTLCTPDGSASQSWNSTHKEMNHGRMDGFAALGESSMAYWDEKDLPFYYSLANTFCLANRWFGSAPCQTYPNRRFLLAGTAFGLISTDTSSITKNPPNGTIFDRLNAHNISWRDYFTDVPATGVIESVPQNNPSHLAPIDQFYADCAVGNLPSVSFVDSDIGVAHEGGSRIPAPFVGSGGPLDHQDQDEETGDLSLGENFVSGVVNAVLKSPSWPRILLVWLYDEHGGWYDHVPPPPAIPPDSIPPKLGHGDVPGGYDIYGPRVPAVVVSGYAKPHGVTNVVHDHTSILATIEAKWNLPAMTFRDANANTLADFLHSAVRFPQPPTLAAPSDLPASERNCDSSALEFQVHPSPPQRQRLIVGSVGRRRGVRGLVVEIHTNIGTLSNVTVELVRDKRVVARTTVRRVGTAQHLLVLRSPRGASFAPGSYELVIRHGRRTLAHRLVRVSGRPGASH
jgi:phospholipase C